MAAIEATESRDFRSEESYRSERITRSKIKPFLKRKGFTNIEDLRSKYGMNESQLVSAVNPDGEKVKLHVQLCWRRDGKNKKPTGRGTNQRKVSAAQLLFKVKDDDWEGMIGSKLQRAASRGVTHSLFVQRGEGERFVYAACIPLKAVLPIWKKQRVISQRLIDRGALGPRKTRNHATNGNSPAIWLQDDRTPEAHRVADALWGYKGVIDLVQLKDQMIEAAFIDDTFDDCPIDQSQFGADGAPRVSVQRSMVKRDQRVRDRVRGRAKGMCEREKCGESRNFSGFLDVHHILGAEKSDRVWTCVALCPNCHREAHFSPNCGAINAELLKYASKYKKKE